MAFRMMHLADLHLGWEPWFLPDDLKSAWRAEREARLAQAIGWALDPAHAIDMVVVAGDLFETHRPPAPLVEKVLEDLSRLADAGVCVVTLPGNHDEISYPDSVYQTHAGRWPGVLIQNPCPDAIGPIDAAGQPVFLYTAAYSAGLTPAWPPIDELPARRPASGWHIGLFHARVWDEEAGAPGTTGAGLGVDGAGGPVPERCLFLTAGALARAGYDYVALGHDHRHRVIPAGRTPAVYCGAVDGRDFDDPGVGFLTVVELSDGDFRLHRVPVGRRAVRTLEVDTSLFSTADELFQWAAEILTGRAEVRPLVRLRLRGAPAFALDAKQLQARIAPLCFHAQVQDLTEGADDSLLARLAGEPTVRGEFVRRLQAKAGGPGEEAQTRRSRRALRLGLEALGAVS